MELSMQTKPARPCFYYWLVLSKKQWHAKDRQISKLEIVSDAEVKLQCGIPIDMGAMHHETLRLLQAWHDLL